MTPSLLRELSEAFRAGDTSQVSYLEAEAVAAARVDPDFSLRLVRCYSDLGIPREDSPWNIFDHLRARYNAF